LYAPRKRKDEIRTVLLSPGRHRADHGYTEIDHAKLERRHMLMVIPLALVLWVLVALVVVGLCVNAARGDRAQRTAAPAARKSAPLRLVS
jgi:hypothetical protein